MPLTFDNKQVEALVTSVASARKIVIISHMVPDGDAVGSTLAMKNLLREHSPATITTILPNPCPQSLLYLPGSEAIIDADNHPEQCLKALGEADLIVAVDFNTPSRISSLCQPFSESKATKVLIDHHHEPEEAAFNVIFSIPDSSSTCEMVYWIARQAGWSIDDRSALCIYNGIITDTGSFSYACQSSSLYEAVADLITHGIDASEVHNRLFNNYTVMRMKLLGHCLNNLMTVHEAERLAFLTISQADLRSFGASISDIEGFVQYNMMMQPIEVGATIKEIEPGLIRLSIRSKSDFDVRLFAANHYGGGGHTRAAGATIHQDLNTFVKEFESTILDELRKSHLANE